MEEAKDLGRHYCFVVKLEIDYFELIHMLEEVCHMTLEEIAEEGRFSRQSLHNWKKGICEPDKTNRANLLRISKNHGIEPPAYFLDLRGLSPNQRRLVLDFRASLLDLNQNAQ